MRKATTLTSIAVLSIIALLAYARQEHKPSPSRVSCRDQSHASQLPDLERWVASQEGEVAWFRDTFSGRTLDRPGMDKWLADLRAGKVERIVVWRLDRLGRTTKGLCQLFDELAERKVDLVSLGGKLKGTGVVFFNSTPVLFSAPSHRVGNRPD